jgi:hypothetical protein
MTGSMTVDCHRCLVPLPLAIDAKYLLIVKLDCQEEAVTEHEDEGVELIYLRSHEFKLSISQPVYESSLLAFEGRMAEKAASSAASWPLSSQHLDWSLAQLQQYQITSQRGKRSTLEKL